MISVNIRGSVLHITCVTNPHDLRTAVCMVCTTIRAYVTNLTTAVTYLQTPSCNSPHSDTLSSKQLLQGASRYTLT